MTTKFTQISAGYSRSLALLDDNSAWAWGNIGRIASATPADDPLAAICGFGPVEIGHNRYAQPLPQLLNPQNPLSYLTDAMSGLMALDMGGQAEMLATTTSLSAGSACVPIAGLTDRLKQVCANETASYALDANGGVWSWGSNFQGQLGRQSDSMLSQQPAKIDALPTVVSIVTGKNHTLALTDKGEVWAWGANAAGQLGQGDLSSLTKPARVRINAPIRSIATGDTHSLAIDANGRLYAWGSNNLGQLGPAQTKTAGWSAKPVRVPLSFKLKQIDAGMHFTAALSEQGEVYAWGWNAMGQLGDPSLKSTNSPTKITALKRVDKISVGSFHTLALNSEGLYAWGDNRNAACGVPSNRAAVVTQPNLITFA